MRIALVHYSAPPVVGGVETVIGAHARLFRHAGMDVRIVASSGECDRLIRKGPSTPEVAVALDGCDLVIVHNVLTMPFDTALTNALWELAGAGAKRRWIGWVHDLASENPEYVTRYSGESAWVRLTTAHPSVEYIAVSEARSEQFQKRTGQTCRVIPNGIDAAVVLGFTDSVRELADARKLMSRELVLLHPARILPRKNIEMTLRATAALREAGRDAACVVTGAPDPHNRSMVEYARELENLRRELGLEQEATFVHEHFAASEMDMASLYRMADAVIFPSKQEGFGLPVIESALHGVPVFCPRKAPLNALLEGGVTYFDESAKPGEVARLIAERLSDCERFRARKEVVRRYAWEAIYQNHLVALVR